MDKDSFKVSIIASVIIAIAYLISVVILLLNGVELPSIVSWIVGGLLATLLGVDLQNLSVFRK